MTRPPGVGAMGWRELLGQSPPWGRRALLASGVLDQSDGVRSLPPGVLLTLPNVCRAPGPGVFAPVQRRGILVLW